MPDPTNDDLLDRHLIVVIVNSEFSDFDKWVSDRTHKDLLGR
jgi:hypothetical protein